MDDKERLRKEELLEAHKERLHQRQLQLAQQGISADPSINIEIKRIEKQLKDLTDQLEEMLRDHENKPSKRIDDRDIIETIKEIIGIIKGLLAMDKGLLNVSESIQRSLELDTKRMNNSSERTHGLEKKTYRLENRMKFAICIIVVLSVAVLWLLVRNIL